MDERGRRHRGRESTQAKPREEAPRQVRGKSHSVHKAWRVPWRGDVPRGNVYSGRGVKGPSVKALTSGGRVTERIPPCLGTRRSRIGIDRAPRRRVSGHSAHTAG